MIKGFKEPTQEELDAFYKECKKDESIAPYLYNIAYHPPKKIYESDWFGLMYISDCGKCLLNINMMRGIDLEFEIALFSKTPLLSGRSLIILKKAVQMYKPKYINSTVKASNEKSLHLTRRILGEEWGVEKGGCYNFVKGEREDLHYFRSDKLLY